MTDVPKAAIEITADILEREFPGLLRREAVRIGLVTLSAAAPFMQNDPSDLSFRIAIRDAAYAHGIKAAADKAAQALRWLGDNESKISKVVTAISAKPEAN